MFVIKVPKVNFSDPWETPLDIRLSELAKGDGRVAYYYDYPDNSTFRYRVYNMMQVLKESKNKHSAAFFCFKDLDYLDKVVDLADVLVFCRARYNQKINQAITRARNKGKQVFFDIDDLVFNPAYTHLILDTLAQDLNNPNVWDFWFGYIGRQSATLSLCDRVITTNAHLAAQLEAYSGKPISIIPNFMNREQMEISNRIYEDKKKSGFLRDHRIHVGYFSGTPSHEKDLNIAADALVHLLKADPRIVLRVVGYLDVKPPLYDYESRIEVFELQDYLNLQRLIGEVEINLVPLQNNVFTNCKSELKYFEAGIVGTLTIASPSFTYRRSILDRENGYLARSFEWYEKIQSLIRDLEYYPIMAEKAYQDSQQKFAWYNQVDLVEQTLFAPARESQKVDNRAVELTSNPSGLDSHPPELVDGKGKYRDPAITIHSKYLFHKNHTPSRDRKDKLLSLIRPSEQDGVEIGPLSHPIVTKDESLQRVKYVDYASREKLEEVYGNDTYVRVSEIVDIDYIWGERSLAELVEGKRFDYAIASHVIEHVPDMLGWLKEIADILKDHGILSLAIPDKRYTFDYLRELSSPGLLIDAYLRHLRQPSPQAVFDYVGLSSPVDLDKAWEGAINKADLSPTGTLDQAFQAAQNSYQTGTYHDAHVNVFTPTNFIDLLEKMSRLGLIDFVLVDFYDTAPRTLEFIVSLERLPRNLDRQASLDLQLAGLDWARNQIH